ncbi:MAG: hypothetical protein EKK46_15715 [Rhodocyclaceae bacterium]|nr:MAG: hypothetical protein EKK46_15715 [Rhodocyclaceae bacterium]
MHEVRSLSARLYTEKYGKECADALLGRKSAKITERYRDERDGWFRPKIAYETSRLGARTTGLSLTEVCNQEGLKRADSIFHLLYVRCKFDAHVYESSACTQGLFTG